MRADRSGYPEKSFARLFVARFGVDLRLAGLGIDPEGPVLRREAAGAEELAGFRIEHVEITVLGRVQRHVAGLTAYIEVGERDLGVAVVIPAVFRRFLEVPAIFAGVRVDRDDRAGV